MRVNFSRPRAGETFFDVHLHKISGCQLADRIAAVNVRQDLQIDVGHRVDVFANIFEFGSPRLVMYGAGEHRNSIGDYLSDKNVAARFQRDGGETFGMA